MNTLPETDPNRKTRRIGFPDGGSVDVREIDDHNWSVLKAFEYQGTREVYQVAENERTDFASVPRVIVWLIPTYGRYTKAAILHDHLCNLAKAGKFVRRDADGLFRQAMRTEGVAFLRRWVMWAGVRCWGVLNGQGWQGFLRDGLVAIPLVLVVFVLTLPAIVWILLVLLLWYVAEFVALIPLRLAHRLQTEREAPTKQVNVPKLTFRT
jgi:hypothetical protein